MGLSSLTAGAIKGLIEPLTNLVVKVMERKQAKDTLVAKAKLAQQQQETNITLTDGEWEVLALQHAGDSWLNEYVTLVLTWPLVSLFVGGLVLAFTGDARMMQGTLEAIAALEGIGVNVGLLMEAVVFTALGLKLWRRL